MKPELPTPLASDSPSVYTGGGFGQVVIGVLVLTLAALTLLAWLVVL